MRVRGICVAVVALAAMCGCASSGDASAPRVTGTVAATGGAGSASPSSETTPSTTSTGNQAGPLDGVSTPGQQLLQERGAGNASVRFPEESRGTYQGAFIAITCDTPGTIAVAYPPTIDFELTCDPTVWSQTRTEVPFTVGPEPFTVTTDIQGWQVVVLSR